jgi:hypothetical protein
VAALLALIAAKHDVANAERFVKASNWSTPRCGARRLHPIALAKLSRAAFRRSSERRV